MSGEITELSRQTVGEAQDSKVVNVHLEQNTEGAVTMQAAHDDN